MGRTSTQYIQILTKNLFTGSNNSEAYKEILSKRRKTISKWKNNNICLQY